MVKNLSVELFGQFLPNEHYGCKTLTTAREAHAGCSVCNVLLSFLGAVCNLGQVTETQMINVLICQTEATVPTPKGSGESS